MISVFPRLYPDEHILSIFARYKAMMGYVRDSEVWRDLFNCYKMPINLYQPYDLRPLESALPADWEISIKALYLQHTATPYLSVFYQEDERKVIYEGDLTKSPVNTRAKSMERELRRIGIKYCPICVNEDIHAQGEPYWHREHQLPYVHVCAGHQTFLQQINIADAYRGNGLIAASKAGLNTKDIDYVNEDNPDEAFLLKVSQYSQQLLKYGVFGCSIQTLKQLIHDGLYEAGLKVYKQGYVSSKEAEEFIESYYSQNLMDLMGFRYYKGYRLTWPKLIACKYYGPVIPIHVIMAFVALGVDIRRLFIASTDDSIPKVTSCRATNAIGFPEKLQAYAAVWYDEKSSGDNSSWSQKTQDAVAAIKSSNRRVTKNAIAKKLGVSLYRLNTVVEIQELINVSLEEPIDFARRKIKQCTRDILESGAVPTPMMVVYRSSTHRYYKSLKSYIEEVITTGIEKQTI